MSAGPVVWEYPWSKPDADVIGDLREAHRKAEAEGRDFIVDNFSGLWQHMCLKHLGEYLGYKHGGTFWYCLACPKRHRTLARLRRHCRRKHG